jgi:hypothetical protein
MQLALRQKVGAWAVLKQAANLPWWHPERLRPEFVVLPSRMAHRTLRRFLGVGDVLAEEVCLTSVDSRGHFGELRVYSLVGPVMN